MSSRGKSRFLKFLRRRLTILLVPHADIPLWRFHFSFSFLISMFLLWTSLTLWAGFVVSRNVDYWITKADNLVMRVKVAYFADRVQKAEEVLKMAQSTDIRMRQLLAMRTQRAIIESPAEAIGGPNAKDHFHLTNLLSARAHALRQSVLGLQSSSILKQSRERLASFQEVAWHIANQRNLFRATPNMWPTEGSLTSLFGYRLSPFQNHERLDIFHQGIDIANNADTVVYATADGVVRHCGWEGGYGRMILLDHGFGYSTLYAHTSQILVKEGDFAKRGQVIAYMGTTGRSTGDHLHYEVWQDGKPANPLKYLKVHPDKEPEGSSLIAFSNREK